MMPSGIEIPLTRCLDNDGRLLEGAPDWARDEKTLVALYRAMVLTRTFDQKAVSLQRTGRLGTYASSLGQEATTVGLAAAMREEDVLLPSFRESGALFWRGVRPADLLLYWGGDERGSDFQGPREDFPICVPVATQLPHAAGVALAFALRGEARVAVAVLGDGGTSKGDFYEALNIAGVWRLPMVTVINNNGWAISVPRAKQTAAATLAQKAHAAGLPGEQVDGNDVIAVKQAVGRAIERARTGGGASVVEALTYRLSDHTTADDARRYRSDEEVSGHWQDEPVARLRRYLSQAFAWNKQREEAIHADCAAAVEAAVESYLAVSPPPASAMFDYLYAELPEALAPQRTAVLDEEAETKDA